MDRTSRRPLSQPHPDRLAPDHPARAQILAAHDAAMAAGRPGYLDPASGLFVFTAATLASKRRCCGSGCRHCPYLPLPAGSGSGTITACES